MNMLATAFMNSYPFHAMPSGKLGLHTGNLLAHTMINTKHVSNWGLQYKAPTKVNAKKLGALDSNILNQEKEGPNMVSDLGLRKMIQDGFIFQEKVCIRYYEVGPDQTASVETVMNHLLETSVNHMKTIGLMHDGFGSEEMSKNNLTWVVAKTHVVVDRYPTWGEIVQIDTWKSAHGKNGVCCNLTFCDCKTGEILVRASSIWVMLNKNTRKLSKFPNMVRAKLEQCFVDTLPTVREDTRTWSGEAENIYEHICKGLMPRWSDLDINQHVNHVKYIGLVIESVPKTIVENYEIHILTLEYFRECTKDNVLQSLTSILGNDKGIIAKFDFVDCHHLLQIGGGRGNIMKGRTRWRLKHRKTQGSGPSVSSLANGSV
ncbi:palmitoyl-acyl carrier protein thioesterase, chloroplastic isoform X1 [Lactuca sativa]|uniref:palmitoyl-acyl carrier protein thioesterase, chloroplastic isoform X1 n=1 Tax=Lactuca sativa TaxID=4236 RepID=UPI000CD9F8B1|nr:palmitoyl-acyl carrier protein thioesterase, chloroplastic isoform X1 [Lactuca sativa]